MKNLILLITIIASSSVFSQSFENGIYFWKNHSKKLFNYYVKPDLSINIEKLNSGERDYYAMITVKTILIKKSMHELKELAGNYKLKPITSNMASTVMELNFNSLDDAFEIEILNLGSGPGVDESFFINKQTYEALNTDDRFEAHFQIKLTPLISKVIETKSLPASTCQNLSEDGLKLSAVASQYLILEEKINKMNFKNSETKRRLIREINSKCFESQNIYASSFSELMNLQINLLNNSRPIKVELTKDMYQEKVISLVFNGKRDQ